MCDYGTKFCFGIDFFDFLCYNYNSNIGGVLNGSKLYKIMEIIIRQRYEKN